MALVCTMGGNTAWIVACWLWKYIYFMNVKQAGSIPLSLYLFKYEIRCRNALE